MTEVTFTLNGEQQSVDVEPDMPVLWVLRDVIGATGTNSPLLEMIDMPPVEVHVVPSTGHPTGVGEMAVPVVIPAVLNAVFAASGIRFRSLPLVWP